MQDLSTTHPFVILGATGATGRQLAHDLHGRGAKLRLIARDQAKLEELAGSLDAQPTVLADASPTSVRDALMQACADGPAAGIAHCIGSLLLKPAKRTTVDEWNDVIQTNLASAFGVTMAAQDCLKEGGSVVFCSSVAASLGLPNHEAIAAAKAGLVGLARAASASHLRRKIRFHCIAPALVESQMTEALLSRSGMREATASQNPSGRIGQPEDVARAIAFLLDPDNDWITGQVLGVDGGFGVVRGLG